MHGTIGASPREFKDFPIHSHPTWEILYCLHGTGTARIDGIDYPYNEGTIFCIPPETPHSKTSEAGFTDISIFSVDFLPPEGNMVQHFQDDASGSFRLLLDAAFHIQLQNLPNKEGIVDAIMTALSGLLTGYSQVKKTRSMSVESFQQLLMDHLTDPHFVLAEAVEATGYSPSHFRKLFKAATGQPPLSYFNHMKIEYAKTLLRQGGKQVSVHEIAESAGFSDPLYFSRLFRQYTGTSPSVFPGSIYDWDPGMSRTDARGLS